MFDAGIRMVPIAGSTARPSLFGSTVNQTRGFYPTLAGGPWLGETGMEWYDRARNAIAKFDQLLARTNGIPSKAERDTVLAWVGPVGSSDTPRERYLTVVENVHYVEASDPIDYTKYEVSRLQNRVKKLEAYNVEFEDKIRAAELVSGVKPPAPGGTAPGGLIPKGGTTPSAGGTGGTNWTLPLIVGGGAIAVAVLVSLLAGKK